MNNQMKKDRIQILLCVFFVLCVAFYFLLSIENKSSVIQITLFFLLVFMILLFIVIISLLSESVSNRTTLNFVEDNQHTFHDYSRVSHYFSEINDELELLKELYNRFIKVLEAFSSDDRRVLRQLCTDSLYQSYLQDLQRLERKGERHIRDTFSLFTYNIQEIIEENQTVIIRMTLHISFFEYYVDFNGNFIRGDSDTQKVHKQFLLEYVIDKEKNILCPNCGSRISGRECEYCHTSFQDVYYDFALSKVGLIENRHK